MARVGGPQRQRIQSRPTKSRGGEKNRSKRKEKRSNRKERDIPGTSVGGASRGARADTTRGGGSCGARDLEPWPRPGTVVATDMPTSKAAMSTTI